MKARGIVVIAALLLATSATAAVFLYVRGVRAEARTGGDMIEVVVAKQDIPPGANIDVLIQEGAFTTRAIPENFIVEGAVTGLGQLQGRRTSSPIVAGEQISAARLRGSDSFGGGALGIPKGLEALTIPLDISRAAGGILRQGDHVTVFGTFSAVTSTRGGGVSQRDVTSTLIPDAEVLKMVVSGGVAGGQGAGANEEGTMLMVTMALSPKDAQRVVFAMERGTVWMALLPPEQAGESQPPVSYKQVA